MPKLKTMYNTVVTQPLQPIQPMERPIPKLEVGNTPIEIALGIDEQGRTTAIKLYGFLELAKSQYSRWVRANITENDFAEEGTDYFSTSMSKTTNKENSTLMSSLSGKGKGGRGNTQDYILTATFAKKLAMTSNTERGEQAREYFIRVEEQLKKIAIAMANRQSAEPVQPSQSAPVIVPLNDIFILDLEQAKARYNMGSCNLRKIADECGAMVMIGNRKNRYLRERLDDYFRRHAE